MALHSKISDQMADFLGLAKGTLLSRPYVTRQINTYIHENKLCDGSKINPDNKLKKLLVKPTDELTYFNLEQHMSQHFQKVEPTIIPEKVKTNVWNAYIGADIDKHRCLCCKKTVINQLNFEVGHVASESNGGTLEIGNLRPICSTCHYSMGTRNMVDFIKMFSYYMG
jgi:hypothetical protein